MGNQLMESPNGEKNGIARLKDRAEKLNPFKEKMEEEMKVLSAKFQEANEQAKDIVKGKQGRTEADIKSAEEVVADANQAEEEKSNEFLKSLGEEGNGSLTGELRKAKIENRKKKEILLDETAKEERRKEEVVKNRELEDKLSHAVEGQAERRKNLGPEDTKKMQEIVSRYLKKVETMERVQGLSERDYEDLIKRLDLKTIEQLERRLKIYQGGWDEFKEMTAEGKKRMNEIAEKVEEKINALKSGDKKIEEVAPIEPEKAITPPVEKGAVVAEDKKETVAEVKVEPVKAEKVQEARMKMEDVLKANAEKNQRTIEKTPSDYEKSVTEGEFKTAVDIAVEKVSDVEIPGHTNKEVAAEIRPFIKEISKEDREMMGAGLAGIKSSVQIEKSEYFRKIYNKIIGERALGFKIEKAKNTFFSQTFGRMSEFFSNKTSKENKNIAEQNTMTRFLSGFANSYKNDADAAQKTIDGIKNGKTKEFRNISYLVGNITRYTRMATDIFKVTAASPFSLAMYGSMFFTRAMGAAKDARFKNAELINKNRLEVDEKGVVKDEAALGRIEEEAWKIYDEAKIKGEKITSQSLQSAFEENLPADLLARLKNKIGLHEASGLMQGIVQKHIESSVGKINDKLNEAKNESEREKILDKYRKHLLELDKIISKHGVVDKLAMYARYAEGAGKIVVGAMTIESLYLLGNNLPKILDGLGKALDEHHINIGLGHSHGAGADIPESVAKKVGGIMPAENSVSPVGPELNPNGISPSINMEHIDYQGGNSVWRESDNQLSARSEYFSEYLGKNMHEGEVKALKTVNVSRLMNKIVESPTAYGLKEGVDVDHLSAEDLKNIKWDQAIKDTFGEKGLTLELSDEQIEKIIDNNETLKEFFKENPLAPRSSENYEAILAGHGVKGPGIATPAESFYNPLKTPQPRSYMEINKEIEGLNDSLTKAEVRLTRDTISMGSPAEAELIEKYTSNPFNIEDKFVRDDLEEIIRIKRDISQHLGELKSSESIIDIKTDQHITPQPEALMTNTVTEQIGDKQASKPAAPVENIDQGHKASPLDKESSAMGSHKEIEGLLREKQDVLDQDFLNKGLDQPRKVGAVLEKIRQSRISSDDFIKYYRAMALDNKALPENSINNIRENFQNINSQDGQKKDSAELVVKGMILTIIKNIK